MLMARSARTKDAARLSLWRSSSTSSSSFLVVGFFFIFFDFLWFSLSAADSKAAVWCLTLIGRDYLIRFISFYWPLSRGRRRLACADSTLRPRFTAFSPANLRLDNLSALNNRVSLAFTGFYRVLPGFTGFYWVLLGFTGFYRVLLGFTGFYWVLPSFTGFHWV